MKKPLHKITFLIIMSSFSNISFSQINLVPNPSFEIYSQCPDNESQINKATGWYSPTAGSPDYYNSCTNNSWISVPQNIIGYQDAKDGVAYAGIYLYILGAIDNREYIQIQLNSFLLQGRKYCAGFYFSLSDSVKYAVNSVGAYFSQGSITSSNYNVLPFSPQVQNNVGVMLNSKTDWMMVSGEFTAQGGEQFLTIGNFNNDANTDTNYVSGGTPFDARYDAYYYVDSVFVYDCDSLNGFSNIEHSTINIFNIKKKITVLNDTKQNLQLRIYNIFGVLIMNETISFKTNFVEKNLEFVPDGIYIISLSNIYQSNILTKKIILTD